MGFASDPLGIRVTIVDPGQPFDPWEMSRKVERPDRGGGAGIEIVRASAQFVDYDVTDQSNTLQLLLPVRWEG